VKVRASELQILYRLVCDKLIEENYSEKLRRTAPRGEGLWSNLTPKVYENRFGGYVAKTDRTYLYRKSAELDGIKKSAGTIDTLTLFKIFNEIGLNPSEAFPNKKFSAAKTKILLTDFQEKFRTEIDALEFDFQVIRKAHGRQADFDRAANLITKYFKYINNGHWHSAWKLRRSYHPIWERDFKIYKKWLWSIHLNVDPIVIHHSLLFEDDHTAKIRCLVYVSYETYSLCPQVFEVFSDFRLKNANEIPDLIKKLCIELSEKGFHNLEDILLKDLLDPIKLHEFLIQRGMQVYPFMHGTTSPFLVHNKVYEITCTFTRGSNYLEIKVEQGQFAF
jgi:hypothetical protein